MDSAEKTKQGELGKIERELAAGDGATYARVLRDDAVVVIPSQVLGKEETVAAIDDAGGWDEFAFEDEREIALGADAGMITYRFAGTRGDFEYLAQLTSVYRRGPDGRWCLALHQQTPLEASD